MISVQLFHLMGLTAASSLKGGWILYNQFHISDHTEIFLLDIYVLHKQPRRLKKQCYRSFHGLRYQFRYLSTVHTLFFRDVSLSVRQDKWEQKATLLFLDLQPITGNLGLKKVMFWQHIKGVSENKACPLCSHFHQNDQSGLPHATPTLKNLSLCKM